MEKHILDSQFTNGSDIQFDYASQVDTLDTAAASTKSSSKKKKKKKKKSGKANGAAAPEFSVDDVTLADPYAEYPTSRVIKINARGDLVVESLDEPQPADEPYEEAPKEGVSEPNEWAPLRKLLQLKTAEEQDFWRSLLLSEKNRIVRLDEDALMARLHLRFRRRQGSFSAHYHNDRDPEQTPPCICCGRPNGYLQRSVDTRFQSLIFDMVDSQRPLMDPNTPFEDVLDAAILPLPTMSSRQAIGPPLEDQHYQEWSEPRRIAPSSPGGLDVPEDLPSDAVTGFSHKIPPAQLPLFAFKEETPDSLKDVLPYLNPHGEFGENLVREVKLKDLSEELKNCIYVHCMLEHIHQYLCARKTPDLLEYRILLESLGDRDDVILQMTDAGQKILYSDDNCFVESFVDAVSELKRNLPTGPSAVESAFSAALSALRSQGSSQKQLLEHPTATQGNGASHPLSEEFGEHGERFQDVTDPHDHSHHTCCEDHDAEHQCSGDSADEEYYNHGHESECGCEDCVREEKLKVESQEKEEACNREFQGMLFIQATLVISDQFKEAFTKKISEDRTQKFIAELEAEENAKKEKELKKQMQKEKQKEKKRLQQLAKEEERRKKEEEELQKAEMLKKKQEELREEQIRRKEELRLKKEEEKLKRIEALRVKEQQQQAELERLAREKEKREKEAAKDGAKMADAEMVTKEEPGGSNNAIVDETTKQESTSLTLPAEPVPVLNAPNINSIIPPQIQEMSPRHILQSVPLGVLNSHLPHTGDYEPQLRQPSVVDSGPPIPQERYSPAKNHLLEQLYQVRPKSNSIVSPSPVFQDMALPSHAPLIPSYSPPKKLFNALNTPPWQDSPLVQPNTLFSQPLPVSQPPMSDNGAWNAPSEAFGGIPLVLAPPNLAASNVWAPTALTPNAAPASGGLIWSSSFTGNPSHSMQHSSIWTQPLRLLDGSRGVEALHAAAFNAIQHLQNTQEAPAGHAPIIKVLQSVREQVGESISMSELLKALHENLQFGFDVVYDDFGSATFVRCGHGGMRASQGELFGHQGVPLMMSILAAPGGQNGSFFGGPTFGNGSLDRSRMNSRAEESSERNPIELGLLENMQGLLNQLGFALSRNGIW